MTARPTLLCTVRDCKSVLQRAAGRAFCQNGHSFDIAKSGYINLLQPQDRRSRQPGDTLAAVRARRKLHESGVTKPLLEEICQLIRGDSGNPVLDVGSGDGFYLGSMAAEINLQACGVDISITAVEASAKRYPDCEWIVANADRFVPYADASFRWVLSLTSRLNRDEFHRLLRTDGKLLVALPAPDDLIELRGSGHDRTERTIRDFESKFELVGKTQTTTTAYLEDKAVQDVLHSIYRPMQATSFKAGLLTFSLDLLVFRPK